VTFFNFSEKHVQALMDIIYGRKVILPVKEKPRFVSLLNKLGIIWTEIMSQEIENVREDSRTEISGAGTGRGTGAVSTGEPVACASELKRQQPPSDPVIERQQPPSSVPAKDGPSYPKSSGNMNDFYALLDEFTETDKSELEKIDHMLLGSSGEADRMYKCMKCAERFKFFTQAEKHHRHHEFLASKPIREKLIKAELDRQSDEKNISKLEKAIGKKDRKFLIRAFRFV